MKFLKDTFYHYFKYEWLQWLFFVPLLVSVRYVITSLIEIITRTWYSWYFVTIVEPMVDVSALLISIALFLPRWNRFIVNGIFVLYLAIITYFLFELITQDALNNDFIAVYISSIIAGLLVLIYLRKKNFFVRSKYSTKILTQEENEN